MLDVSDRTDHWRVLKAGEDSAKLGNYVEQWRRKFAKFSDLPRKTQEAVSELRMCSIQERIDVGVRVGESTFWLNDRPELLAEYEEEKGEDKSK